LSSEHIARFEQIPLSVESELGRCSMPVREILSLAPGSVIKLSSPVGSKVDVSVGGAPFGFGEMTRLGKTIGVRLTGFVVKAQD
jgi:flagellar motor switch/type III secretory pathway protein FliN